MMLPDGRRIYRFYLWEMVFTVSRDCSHTDVSIDDYLIRRELDGETIDDYVSIFNYF
jgi:lysine 2,3-aminomutase